MSLKNATCFVLLFVVLYSAVPAKAHLTLNNTCVHGTNYVQIVGFACLEAEERARNPNWDGNWATQGRYNLRAFELINANMNRLGIHINNLTYCANFTVVHAGCTGDASPTGYPRQVAREWAPRADFFFADYGTTLALPGIIEINTAEKPIFVPMSSATTLFRCRKVWMEANLQPECHKEGDKRFPWAFAMLIPGDAVLNPVVTMYKLAGVRNITVWNEAGSFPETISEGVQSFSQYTRIPTVSLSIPASPSQEEVEQLARKIKDANSDGVIGAANAAACPKLVTALKKLNYMPRAMAQMNCIAEPKTKTDAPDAIYQLDRVEYDRRMNGMTWTDEFWYPPSAGVSSPELVYRDFQARHQAEPHYSQAITLAAGLVLHRVLERVGTLDAPDVRDGIQYFNEPSFIGIIGFSAWGQNNVKDVILYQSDDKFNLQIVYPLGSATANFIYPAPTFDERVYDEHYMSTPSELILSAIITLFIIISLLLFIFITVYKHEQALIAASPLFLATILIGSIMLYCVYFTWVLQATTATCYLRFWLLGVGFVVMFGALFAKTWRIMRIFTLTEVKVFRITNLQLLIILALLIGIEVVLLAIWSGTAQPKQMIQINDPLRPSKNRLVCTSATSSKVMLGILVAYKLAIVTYGIYMSIRIWKIPLKQFNESRSIAFSMYNMLCFGVLAFSLQVSGVISDPAMFIVRSVCLALSTFLTICAIFGPKVFAAITGHTGYSTTGKNTGDSYPTQGLGSTFGGGTLSNKQSRSLSNHSSDEGLVPMASLPTSQADDEATAALLHEIEKYKRKYDQLMRKYKKALSVADASDSLI